MFLIFIFKLLPTLWAGVTVVPCVANRTTVTMWLKGYLIFYVQNPIYTRIFDFRRWCLISMFARLYTCIGQVLSERGVFGER